MSEQEFVIGVDFGTDSVRAILVNAANGAIVSSNVYWYPRWMEGKFCDPLTNRFRQHPKDHLEGLEHTLKNILAESAVPPGQIKGIGVDTTGSSPVPVDRHGKPLALQAEFKDNPNAMVLLWKDHTAIREAAEITSLAKEWGGTDYTQYEGGIYSSERFWAKILHIIREDEQVARAAYSWMEHCDVIVHELTGAADPVGFKRSRCAAGHKALWHKSWGGLPSRDFLSKLDARLGELKERLYTDTFTSDTSAGRLSAHWASKLGLSPDTVVAVGLIDAHAGAVGGKISPNNLVKVMGTSTCDMMVASYNEIGEKPVRGICGQVDGSVVPGMVGLEAGQSGFGDVLAWFGDMITQPTIAILNESLILDKSTKVQLTNEIKAGILAKLSKEAFEVPISETAPVALDWINGRRTPDGNQGLKGAIMGLNAGTDAVRFYKALVESLCFGSRKIIERLREEGMTITTVIGMGGVAKKSPFVMQTMADVLGMPIKVSASDQTPALGASIFAALASGIYKDPAPAIEAMGSDFDQVYEPIAENELVYQKLYEKYCRFGNFVEMDLEKEW